MFAERRSTPLPGPSTLTYLLSDHLNSTVGTTSTASEAVDRMQYYPFGSARSGGVATDRTYTGQQTEAGSALKLSYYHARFYSAELGHFVSADTSAVDGLDRYSYAQNNPVRYSDPTGHCVLLLPCAPSSALNIAACASSLRGCKSVIWAMGKDLSDQEIEDIRRFSLWAIDQVEYWQHFFSDSNPYRNRATLNLAESDPGGVYKTRNAPDVLFIDADRVLLGRQRFGERVAETIDSYCGSTRDNCASLSLTVGDLALITAGLVTGNQAAFGYGMIGDENLRASLEAQIYGQQVVQEYRDYLRGDASIHDVWNATLIGVANLAPVRIQLFVSLVEFYNGAVCEPSPERCN